MTNFVFGNNQIVSGFKNKLINGDFRIWQRGTSFTNMPSVSYSADRWIGVNSGGATTISRQSFITGQTEVPGNPEFYLKMNRTTVGSVPNGILSQRIEDVRILANTTVTVSFWAKGTVGKRVDILMRQLFGLGGTPGGFDSNEVNIFLTSSWKKYSFQLITPSIVGKTIGVGSAIDLEFNENNNFSIFELNISQVQVEAGSVATNFEQRLIGIELQLAQRYYEELDGNANIIHSERLLSASVNFNHSFSIVEKRAVPTVVTEPVAISGANVQGNWAFLPSKKVVVLQGLTFAQNYNYNIPIIKLDAEL